MQFEEYKDKYIASQKKYLAPRTIVEYVSDLFGAKAGILDRLGDLTPLTLKRFLEVYPASAQTTNRKLAACKSFFDFLVEEGVLEANPAAKIKRFSVDSSEPLPFTPSDIEEIRVACSNLMLTIVEVLYATGIRISEMIKIDKLDVNFDTKTIRVLGKRVRGKGKKPRRVLFTNNCGKILVEYIGNHRDTTEPALFVSTKGKRLTLPQVEYMFKKLSKGLGKKIKPHNFRHTFASEALNRGMNLKQVQSLLGHSSISSTGIYIHITEDVRLAYDRAFNE